MLSAIAIDDEPDALEILKSHAARVPFLKLQRVFTNPFEALEYIRLDRIDLVFLDIRMPDLSGLDFSQAIRKENPLIIFTTAHSEYALKSYDVEALDYLLKPFDFSRFLKAVTKAQESLRHNIASLDFFFVNTGYQQRKICFNDIKYIEGDGNYVTYHTDAEKIIVRSTIKETLSLLPPRLFIQIHRSYIISLRQLDKIQDNHAFVGDHRISIGASYKDRLVKLIK